MDTAGDCSLRVAVLLYDSRRREIEDAVRISLRGAVFADG